MDDPQQQIEELKASLAVALAAVPSKAWLRVGLAMQTTIASLYHMPPAERVAALRILRAVKSLNDRKIYPQRLATHNPAIAPEAQALAVKLPCLLESYPRFRVTQLARILLRDERIVTVQPDD